MDVETSGPKVADTIKQFEEWLLQKSADELLDSFDNARLRKFAEDNNVDVSPFDDRGTLVRKIKDHCPEAITAAARPVSLYAFEETRKGLDRISNADLELKQWHAKLVEYELDQLVDDLDMNEMRHLVDAISKNDTPQDATKADLKKLLQAHQEEVLRLGSPAAVARLTAEIKAQDAKLRSEVAAQSKSVKEVESRLWLTDAVSAAFQTWKHAAATFLGIAAFIGLPAYNYWTGLSSVRAAATSLKEEADAELKIIEQHEAKVRSELAEVEKHKETVEKHKDAMEKHADQLKSTVIGYNNSTSSFELTFISIIMNDIQANLESFDYYDFKLSGNIKTSVERNLQLLKNLESLREDSEKVRAEQGKERDLEFDLILDSLKELLTETLLLENLSDEKTTVADFHRKQMIWSKIGRSFTLSMSFDVIKASNGSVLGALVVKLAALSHYVEGVVGLEGYRQQAKSQRTPGTLIGVRDAFENAIDLDRSLTGPHVYNIVALRYQMEQLRNGTKEKAAPSNHQRVIEPKDRDRAKIHEDALTAFSNARTNALANDNLRLFVRASNNLAYFYVREADFHLKKNTEEGNNEAASLLDSAQACLDRVESIGFMAPIVFTTMADASIMQIEIEDRKVKSSGKELTNKELLSRLQPHYKEALHFIETAVESGFSGYSKYGEEIYVKAPHFRYLDKVSIDRSKVLEKMGVKKSK